MPTAAMRRQQTAPWPPLSAPLSLGLLLALMLPQIVISSGSMECQALSDTYLQHHHREASTFQDSSLVFFLHVPRTAGRTLHTCLLKKGTPAVRHCPRAYDHLRM